MKSKFNQMSRYNIVELSRNEGKYTLEELAKRFGVSAATVKRTIKRLKSVGVTVVLKKNPRKQRTTEFNEAFKIIREI